MMTLGQACAALVMSSGTARFARVLHDDDRVFAFTPMDSLAAEIAEVLVQQGYARKQGGAGRDAPFLGTFYTIRATQEEIK